jgi:hypothetical protein
MISGYELALVWAEVFRIAYLTKYLPTVALAQKQINTGLVISEDTLLCRVGASKYGVALPSCRNSV